MKSVTHRWVVNFLTIIVVSLVAVVGIGVVGVKEFYYNSAQQIITSRTEVLISVIQNTPAGSTNRAQVIEGLVASFEETNRFEVMVLDETGRVTMTASGFDPSVDFDRSDFLQAMSSEDQYGVSTKRYGEYGNLMSVCYTGSVLGSGIGGIRVVTSLENVDRNIFIYGLILSGFALIVVFFVVLSGRFFIRSIVAPIGKIGETATKIASGNFSVRLRNEYNDEIGQLCDTINYMSDELQKAETVKNEFISQVSHELRTPLTAIKGWGETVLSADPNDKETVVRGMSVILGETERLSGMVEELLDFSRMQSGRMTLVLSKMDVIAELVDVIIMFGERAKREGVTLNWEDTDLITPVLGDRNRLRQVFVNILDNALKYCCSGGNIWVDTKEKDGFIVITVKDDGIGIPSEDLPRIKERFIKGQNSRRGTGIGLAVADEIMKMHKGYLNLDSVEGQGTTVTIGVPVMDSSVNESTMQIAKIDEEMLKQYEQQSEGKI
ncbi:MAG: HAMP domain-containing histidine kinase [Oscillospiraceae bacterium]|nr:HAMP domain-containing histidine kinase [Oscillospiraceae bacterium]